MEDSIVLKRGETLVDKWYYFAENYPDKEAIVHWAAGEEPFRWTYRELIECAENFAVILRENGIRKNDVCATLIKHNKYFYPIYLAVSLLGALPAVLAYPNSRLHPIKFREGLEGMAKRSGLDFILTEKSLEPVIRPLVEKDDSTIKQLLFPLEWNLEEAAKNSSDEKIKIRKIIKGFSPLDTVILQHSSGTTGLQKPTIFSHKAVLDHIEIYSRAIALNRNDKIVSWLPLYHDMGLIAAFHMPLASGITSVQIDTFEWVMVPSILLEAISKEKGTLMWLPNFAYNMLVDKVSDEDLKDISLKSLRMSINCSEPIRHESHQKFFSRFSNYGLKAKSLSTSYGMTENTFAVTQSEPNKEPLVLPVYTADLANGKAVITDRIKISNTRLCVSSGKAVDGCRIRIVDEERGDLPDLYVGEIAIASETLFDGYKNYPEKNAQVLREGWYYTGDLGFRYGEDYFIIGRKSDTIIVGGNNLYPEDIEDIVSDVEGAIPGRVIAFGEFDEQIGSEQVSVIVETKIEDEQARKNLRMAIVKACMGIDVTVRKVYFVPPRWLIKSSAGKPGRKTNRERILTDEPRKALQLQVQ